MRLKEVCKPRISDLYIENYTNAKQKKKSLASLPRTIDQFVDLGLSTQRGHLERSPGGMTCATPGHSATWTPICQPIAPSQDCSRPSCNPRNQTV